MGVHVRPVGPLGARTYWTRRALLLVPLLLLLLVLRACTGDDGGGDDRLTPAPVGTTAPSSPAAAPEPTAEPTPTTTPAEPSDAPTAAPTAAPATADAVPVCAPELLEVRTSTDATSYPASASPRLTLTVRNTGGLACATPLGQGAVELKVVSGEDRIWSSDDCDPGGTEGPVTLAAGQSQAVAVTWSGSRSLPGCPGDRAQAQPGTYRAVGRAGGLASPPAVFTLT